MERTGVEADESGDKGEHGHSRDGEADPVVTIGHARRHWISCRGTG
jgi:hypothetical protein